MNAVFDGLSITYNSFKQPTQISRSGNSFAFTYGANLERLKEVRNGVTTYEIDKLYEEESSGAWRIYLSDIAIIKYDSTNGQQIRYTHKDRLGSTLTYSDHNGQVTDRRMFDAFGKPRATDGNTLTPPRLQNLTLSRNGFTDHRHLDEVELIHMNGRAYDYNLGRFLSVDPIIQSPGNSQSLNPYSYIMNNPLAGTDPTGYCSQDIGSKICRSEMTGTQLNAMLASALVAHDAQQAVKGNGMQVASVSASFSNGTTTDLMAQSNVSNASGQAIAGGAAIMGRAAAGGASATSTVAKAGSLARVNPVGLILTAMLPTKMGNGEFPINDVEDNAVEDIRAGSISDRRKDPNVVRLQLQTGKENLDSYALTAPGDPGVLKAQAWGALDVMYKMNSTSNADWNRVLGNAVVNMSEKIKVINGGTSGTGNVLRTEFVYRRHLYRIDLENLSGVNLVE